MPISLILELQYQFQLNYHYPTTSYLLLLTVMISKQGLVQCCSQLVWEETAYITVYAFCVGALGSAVVTAAKIPSLSYAMGAEGEEIHPLHRLNYTHVHTHTPHMVPH